MSGTTTDRFDAPPRLSPAGRVVLSEEAQRNLRELPRPTRALVSRTMKDELLEPTSDLDVVPVQSPAGEDDRSWYAFRLGNFRVLFTSLEPESGAGPGDRLVGRVERIQGELSRKQRRARARQSEAAAGA